MLLSFAFLYTLPFTSSSSFWLTLPHLPPHPHFQTSSLSSACLRLLPSSSSSSAQQNRLKMMENLSIFIKEAKKLELKIQVSAPTPRTQCIA